jgi:hypothetical protein
MPLVSTEAVYAACRRIALPFQQATSHESLRHTRDRAGVQANDVRELTGRQARKLADHAQHQALWTGDPNLVLHPLRHALKAVFDRPEETHEVQNRIQLYSISLSRRIVGIAR